jgi:hypothetical protein
MRAMRLHFDRYQQAHSRLGWTSLLLIIFGGLGVTLGSLSAWIGLLMTFMTSGDFWERRAGVFLLVFTGIFPLLIGGLMAWAGFVKRRRRRDLRDLAALARQMPHFTEVEVARALDVGASHAHRVVVDALTLGVLSDSAPPVQLAPTLPAPSAPPGVSGVSWIGRILHGTYRIEGPLGVGGMGTVYRATHLRTGRACAVKTLLPDARLSPDALRRFEREATAASALGHPNIIGVHDFNVTPEGACYLVMDLWEGETLEQRLARVGSMPWHEVQRIGAELGSALTAAHDHGLLHRDLKPANVLLARAGHTERAVLLDFGLVKPIDDAAASRITATGAAVGTPMYMSPEQARGDAVDPRSDIYGLAAVLFEMVTGAPPFLDRTLATVYAKLLTVPAPTASSVAHHPVSPDVDALLACALAKDPGARFSDMRAFVNALTSIRPPPQAHAG